MRDGPLYDLVKSASSGRGLLAVLADDASITFPGSRMKIEGKANLSDFVNAVRSDCKGPYPVDEGKWPDGDRAPWVQVSWVCAPKGSLVGKYFAFGASPEINLEFDFADGKAKSILAAEIVPAPGRKMLRMDAIDTIAEAPHG